MKNRISEDSYNAYEIGDRVFFRDGKDNDFKEGIITQFEGHDQFQVKRGNSEKIVSRGNLWYYKEYRVDNDLLITHRHPIDSSSPTPDTPATPIHTTANNTEKDNLPGLYTRYNQ